MDKKYNANNTQEQAGKNEDRKQVPEENKEVIRENPDNISDPDVSSGVC